MKKILQFLSGLILPIIVFIACLAIVRQFTHKGNIVILGLFFLISLLIFFLRKFKFFFYPYLIVFFTVLCYGLITKVNWQNETSISENVKKETSNKRSYETEENMEILFTRIEDFPSDWGIIHTWETDTFKYIDCTDYTTVNIVQWNSLFILVYDSYYYGNDSLIINYFYQESNENFVFKMESNANEETTWILKLTDRKNLIGNLYDSKKIVHLKNLIANFSKKNYPDMNGPCGD